MISMHFDGISLIPSVYW